MLVFVRGVHFWSLGSGRVRGKLARTLLWVSCVLLPVASPACHVFSTGWSNADDLPPVGVVETLNTLQLTSNGGEDGLATRLHLQLAIEPKTLGVFRVLGRGPRGGPIDDAQIQLTVSWKDFVGLSPTSFGSRKSRPAVFGDDGEASRGAPLQRSFEFVLDTPQPDVLARRVEISARFHPIDVVGDEVRSAGARMDFPDVMIETLARAPEGNLAEWFGEGSERDPAELFLAAASTPIERRTYVISRLIGSLASLKGAEREAGYGALHFLTGVTNGRSVYAWEAWLLQQPKLEEVGP